MQQQAGVTLNTIKLPKIRENRISPADYWKFFQRPLRPSAINFTLDKTFILPKDDEQKPTRHSVGVQSDYRESETQTDPYSPQDVLRSGRSPPELLQLKTLTLGHGLPAGLAEVELIERQRAKRVWEATLPPLSDLSQFEKRKQMMLEMEVKEKAFREQEIKKLQDARLAALREKLSQSEEAQKKLLNERLNRLQAQLLQEQEVKHQKIESDHLREIRKLEAKRENVEGKLKRRDIITDFKGFQLRNQDRKTSEFTSLFLDTYEGLEMLEASLKQQMESSKPKVIKEVTKSPASKAVEELKEYKALIEKEKQHLAEKLDRGLVEEEPEPRPVTPRVEDSSERDEQAAITLQEILRGRTIQTQMFKGKENQLKNIQELSSTLVLHREEEELKNTDKEFVMSLKKQRDQNREKISAEQASQTQEIGEELGELFDTLSKELIRLQEEHRIHAHTLLAERERRRREAEEGGRRQVEEQRHREEDEIFRQVTRVHQESVDMYLKDIILANLEQKADEQIREEIHTEAKTLNDMVWVMEERSRNSQQSEEIVSELVHSFLIPEIEKINFRERVHLKEKKLLETTRSIIHVTAASAGIHPEETSESTSPDVITTDPDQEEVISRVEQEKQTEQQQIQPYEK